LFVLPLDVFSLAIPGLFLVLALFVLYIVGGGFLWGAGYEPVSKRSLKKMLEISEPLRGRQAYDLGSGFGRIVIEVASRHGGFATGFEMDPLKVWWSRLMITRKGLGDRARIIWGNLLEADISGADVVYVFLWPGIMEKVRSKVLKEMRPGALVVSYWHRFRDWTPEVEEPELRVYAYRIPNGPKIQL
jgi:hypothetical protein